MGQGLCAVSGCGAKMRARGLCIRHYTRWRRHGDVHYRLKGIKRLDRGCKLEIEDVIQIKEALQSPYLGVIKNLALKYGVDQSLISQIKNGDRWAHDLEELKKQREYMLKTKGGE